MGFWNNIGFRNTSLALLAVLALTHMLVGPDLLKRMGSADASAQDGQLLSL